MSNNSEPDAAAIEATQEYDIPRLLHLARLLTSDTAFLMQDGVSVETLLNLDKAPSCDADTGEFVDLLGQLSSQPPTYTGDNPIGDITTTLRQLASCQRSTKRSLLSKIGDFFMRRDGGKALRQLLLLSKVVIECLSLWYVMQRNDLLGQPGTEDFRSMQEFCRQALAAHGVSNVDLALVPASISKSIARAQQWDRNLSTVVSTFRLDTQYPAPVLLIFSPNDLEVVMRATELSGKLPPQQERDDSGSLGDEGGSNTILPMVFLPQSKLRPIVQNYLRSGPVKQAN